MEPDPVAMDAALQRAFAKAVRVQRALWGYDQAALASLAGLQRTTLAKIETGSRKASLGEVAVICSVFGQGLPLLLDPVIKVAAAEEADLIEKAAKSLAGGWRETRREAL